MSEQTTLLEQPPKLTDRQHRALGAITAAGWHGINNETLGRLLGANDQWAAASGLEVGRALRKKGLAKQRRREHGTVWTIAQDLAKPVDRDNSYGVIPF